MNTSTIARFATAGVLLGSVLAGGTAYAEASTPTTQQFHGTQPFSDPDPCTGATITGTEVVTGHIHEVDQTGGQIHFVFTEEGWADATDAATGVSYSGHFSVAGGDNMNARSDTESITQSTRIVGSDGSVRTVHEVMHVTADANGNVTVSFDDVRVEGCD